MKISFNPNSVFVWLRIFKKLRSQPCSILLGLRHPISHMCINTSVQIPSSGKFCQDRETRHKSCFCFKQIGTTISPFIIYVGTITGQTGIPTAIFGAIMVASSFCLLFTPETKNSPLAQTVEELKDSGYPSIFHRFRKNKIGVDQNSSFQLH